MVMKSPIITQNKNSIGAHKITKEEEEEETTSKQKNTITSRLQISDKKNTLRKLLCCLDINVINKELRIFAHWL